MLGSEEQWKGEGLHSHGKVMWREERLRKSRVVIGLARERQSGDWHCNGIE